MSSTQETERLTPDQLWDSVTYELPSVNEAKAASSYEVDEVADGVYQFQITEISPPLDNAFGTKERRAFTLLIVGSDDPMDVGLKVRQYYNISTHPLSSLYPLFRATAGGDLDPSVRPKLIDLRDAQFKASLVTVKNQKGDDKQELQGIMPAKKRIEPPPF